VNPYHEGVFFDQFHLTEPQEFQGMELEMASEWAPLMGRIGAKLPEVPEVSAASLLGARTVWTATMRWEISKRSLLPPPLS
jgi:hypothetical protein